MNKEAMSQIGDLEIEVRQMEGRVSSSKLEIQNLEKRKRALVEEANGIRLNVEADAAKRIAEGREATKKMQEERAQLDGEKAQLAKDQAAYKQDKVALDRAREDADNTMKNYQKMTEKVSRFLSMVKREGELL